MDTSVLIITILLCLSIFFFLICMREIYHAKKKINKVYGDPARKKMELAEKLEELQNYHIELTKKEEDFKNMGKQIMHNAKCWENLKKIIKRTYSSYFTKLK
ncbi:hypothetical protein [Chryseobacterium sp. POE27]|uniref:hypothetical protein n=1 Tax=Chryseobacterium sp. POE27 TaxID=3138177 RepID=UPI00321A823B